VSGTLPATLDAHLRAALTRVRDHERAAAERAAAERERAARQEVLASLGEVLLKAVAGGGLGTLLKAAAHAPAGGVTVQGKEYKGGEFIPAEVMEQATPEEKAKVAGKGEPTAADPAKPDRYAGWPKEFHFQRGGILLDRLRRRLLRAVVTEDEAELENMERKAARVFRRFYDEANAHAVRQFMEDYGEAFTDADADAINKAFEAEAERAAALVDALVEHSWWSLRQRQQGADGDRRGWGEAYSAADAHFGAESQNRIWDVIERVQERLGGGHRLGRYFKGRPADPETRLTKAAAALGLSAELAALPAWDYDQLLADVADECALERITKADRSHLVRKIITNKLGRRQVVWVRPEEGGGEQRAQGQGAEGEGQGGTAPAAPRTKTREQVLESRTVLAAAVNDPSRLTPAHVEALADHIDSISKEDAKGLLRQLGLKVGGRQMEVAQRLYEAIRAGRAAAGGVGDALREAPEVETTPTESTAADEPKAEQPTDQPAEQPTTTPPAPQTKLERDADAADPLADGLRRSAGGGGPLLSQPDDQIAAKVIDAAKAQEYGFYENKVFISDIYDALKRDDPSLTEAEFKRKLIDLNADGKIHLSRVDEVQDAHPDDLARSKVSHPLVPSATFHAVLLDGSTGGVRPRKNRKDEPPTPAPKPRHVTPARTPDAQAAENERVRARQAAAAAKRGEGADTPATGTPAPPKVFDQSTPEGRYADLARRQLPPPESVTAVPKTKAARKKLAADLRAAWLGTVRALGGEGNLTPEQEQATAGILSRLEVLATGGEMDGPHDLGPVSDARYAGYYRGVLASIDKLRATAKPEPAKPATDIDTPPSPAKNAAPTPEGGAVATNEKPAADGAKPAPLAKDTAAEHVAAMVDDFKRRLVPGAHSDLESLQGMMGEADALMGKLDALKLSGEEWKALARRVMGVKERSGAAARLAIKGRLTAGPRAVMSQLA